MTDKPTPEQIQRACDLANASNPAFVYTAIDYDDLRNHSFRALADTIAKLDAKDAMIDGQAALIATLTAERDKARADLGEIYIQLDGVSGLHRLADDSRQAIEAAHDLAAPYRVETDPLDDLLWQTLIAWESGDDPGYGKRLGSPEGLPAWDTAKAAFRAELAKRGLEIGRSA